VAFGEISYLLSLPTLNHNDAHMGLLPLPILVTGASITNITPDQAHYVMSAAGFELCAG